MSYTAKEQAEMIIHGRMWHGECNVCKLQKLGCPGNIAEEGCKAFARSYLQNNCWETVQEWQDRMDKSYPKKAPHVYPGDGPVWRRIVTPGGHRTKWKLLQYGEDLFMSDWQENIVPRIGYGRPPEKIGEEV